MAFPPEAGPDDPWSTLFEFLPIGAYRSTPDGRQLRANPALVRLNGFASEAEQIAAVRDIATEWYVDPTRRAQFKALIERDDRVVAFESEIYRHKTRERIWVRENAHAVRGTDGRVRHYEGTVEEITDIVRTREALALSEASVRELVSLVPCVIYRLVLGPGGRRRFTFISERVQELYGVSAADVMADSVVLTECIHPADRERVAREAARVAEDGAQLDLEFRIRHTDGRERWVQWRGGAAGAGSEPASVRVGVAIDVTERKRAEIEAARSQVRLQQLVDLIPGVVFRLRFSADGARRYSFVSDRVRELYGLEPEEVLRDGWSLARLRRPDAAEQVARVSDKAIAEGRELDYEVPLRLRDGTEKWVHLRSAPGPAEDGDPVRVGVLLDVTARKKAQLALQQQSELWLGALQASGDGVWDWRVQDGVEILSPQCKAMYGFAPGELPDRPDALDDRTHPNDRAAMQAAREEHFAGRTARYVNEHRVRCKDGSWKWILSRGFVIERDAMGRPLRMIGTHTDVTAAKQAEGLRLERDNAAAADRAKSEFLSRVSHELRTPLNAVLGFAQLLDLDPGGSGERQRGWVQQVLDSGRHLLALLEDILDLSSLQSGRLAMVLEPVSLEAVVDEAWTMLAAGSLSMPGLMQRFDNQVAGLGCVVRADRKRLKQIVGNLLSNAIKYNRAEGWVRVAVAEVPPARDGAPMRWELRVSDQGHGLDEQQLARLYQPFDRLGAERGPVAGTGLGLALTRQLVEALGGEIGVASTPGQGSTFWVRLPADSSAG
ncbi:MAG: PAS domain-containing protein [Rubrivivax sp.]|nr:PAS domain-containing protein [Rubrivivax sp.]